MSNLREALEALVADRENTTSVAHQDYVIAPYELRELLAAHPGPARVEITDEMVERSCEVSEGYWGPSIPAATRAMVRDRNRRVLESAVPFLQPQPVDRPLLDRSAVDAALIANADSINRQGDAVMELARPMPTEAEIVGALHRAMREGNFAEDPAERRLRQARAVLALLGGVDESEAGS